MRTLFLCLVAMVLASCAASAPTPLPTPPVTVVEDAGNLCFTIYNAAARELSGTFVPAGCFSTSCTGRLETRFSAPRFPEDTALRFSGRFVLRDTTVRFPIAQACTADCKGAGTYTFTVGNIMTATSYDVWLGPRQVGTFTVTEPYPPSPTTYACFR